MLSKKKLSKKELRWGIDGNRAFPIIVFRGLLVRGELGFRKRGLAPTA